MNVHANRFHFFWTGYLSQWAKSPFTETVDDVTTRYCSAEQYMMAEKARIMGDLATRAQILACTDSREIKALGRRVTPYDDAKWIAVREDVVRRGTRLKFGQNTTLQEKLIFTRGVERIPTLLVEASPYDAIWGIGLSEARAIKTPVSRWPGLNLLGVILTEVRQELIKAGPAPL